ncbi:hypothetical protein F5I97DRAFT_287075 [Phlebopus sp. FC_14]|nr:hypothetical protein F5I97DRAFT_287075 [Phlebopus sp. FC_14]
MSYLPPELILTILEHNFYTSSGQPDHAFLSACSLVCRAWSWPAQSLLFRCVTKLRGRNYSQFAAAVLSPARGQSLGKCVRTLEMSIAHSMKQSCSPLHLVDVLRACPSVYELVLKAYGISKFDQASLEKLRDAGKGLKALHLVFCTMTSSILFQLLNIWPSIQFLKICVDIGVPSSQVLAYSHRGAPVRLYDLVLSSIPHKEDARVVALLVNGVTANSRPARWAPPGHEQHLHCLCASPAITPLSTLQLRLGRTPPRVHSTRGAGVISNPDGCSPCASSAADHRAP